MDFMESSFRSDIHYIGKQQIECIFQALDMGAFPAMAAIDGHAEGSGLNIVAVHQGGGSVRAVKIENIHRIIAFCFFRIFDHAAGKSIGIGGLGILGADGHAALVSIVIGADEPNIQRHIFGYFRGHIGAAQADLFCEGKGQHRAVFGLKALLLHIFEHSKYAGNRRFIINEAGFDIAVFRDFKLRINGNIISVLNTQGVNVLLGMHILIQQKDHGIFIHDI